MRFSEVVSRLTGVSCPVFGVSWKAPEPDRVAARRVLSAIEGRPQLYDRRFNASPAQCVRSVAAFCDDVSRELAALPDGSHLIPVLRGLRSACNCFASAVGPVDGVVVTYGAMSGHYAKAAFGQAMQALTAEIRAETTNLVAAYGLDVDDRLACELLAASGTTAGTRSPPKSAQSGR